MSKMTKEEAVALKQEIVEAEFDREGRMKGRDNFWHLLDMLEKDPKLKGLNIEGILDETQLESLIYCLERNSASKKLNFTDRSMYEQAKKLVSESHSADILYKDDYSLKSTELGGAGSSSDTSDSSMMS